MIHTSTKKHVRIIIAVLIVISLLILWKGCQSTPEPKTITDEPLEIATTLPLEDIPTSEITEEEQIIEEQLPQVIETTEPISRGSVNSVPQEQIIEEPANQEPTTEETSMDRTKNIYDVYKRGYFVQTNPELQWYIHDMANTYGFDEKIIFGLILSESTFQPAARNGNCIGLA